jgi:selenocysteine-specific elongation factor
VRVEGGDVRHREHSGALSGADQALLDRVRGALAQGRGQPPSPEDLEGMLRLTGPDVMRALRLLENRGEVFRAGEAWFDARWLEDAKGRLAAIARERGGFTPSDARTVLDSTRKWVIPLLEALDKSGFTRRTGEKRVLRGAK